MLSRFPAFLLTFALVIFALKVAQIAYVQKQPIEQLAIYQQLPATAAPAPIVAAAEEAESVAQFREESSAQAEVAPLLIAGQPLEPIPADDKLLVPTPAEQNSVGLLAEPAIAAPAITIQSPQPSYQIVAVEEPEQPPEMAPEPAEVLSENSLAQETIQIQPSESAPSVSKQQSIADALAAIRASRAAEKEQAKQQAAAAAKSAINGAPIKAVAERASVDSLCKEVGDKLGSVNERDCLAVGMLDSGMDTTKGRPLGFKHFPSKESSALRVMLMGGIHGDEYSAVSIVFKWLKAQRPQQANHIDWLVVPVSNPDGLLKKGSAQRMNGRGVDLNRNFPTADWLVKAPRYWRWDGGSPRRYPGKKPASEPETQWYLDVIEEYQPDILVQVHAPIGLIDYDGPSLPPKRLGPLALNPLGVYPGSLGNYGASVLNVPVLTIELEHAGIMPDSGDIDDIWHDMVAWIERKHGNLPENTFTKRGGSAMNRTASAKSP